MLTYLEGTRYKLQSALMELDHKPRGSHPLAAHIQITRDRHGLQQSILKVPLWLKNNENGEAAVASSDGTASSPNASSLRTSNAEQADDMYDSAYEGGAPNGGTDGAAENTCTDIRNEAVIKMYAKPYNRSKSSVELTSGSPGSRPSSETASRRSTVMTTPTTAATQNEGNKVSKAHQNGHSSPIFDRGIADGGSNQHDSDFGKS